MNGSAPTSRAVASARQAYASQRVAPVGDPTGDTEDLSDTGDMGPPPRIVAMPMPAQLAAPVPLAVGTAAIVEAARAEMARLDGEIARLGQAVKDREMLAAMLAAVPSLAAASGVSGPHCMHCGRLVLDASHNNGACTQQQARAEYLGTDTNGMAPNLCARCGYQEGHHGMVPGVGYACPHSSPRTAFLAKSESAAPLPADQPPNGPAVYPTPTQAAQANLPPAITAEVARIEAETAEEALDAVHAAEVRAWQNGGPMPSWIR